MSLETNKIFAAICIALIAAWLTSFIAKKAVHPEDLEKDAVEIEGGAVAGASGPAKPQLPDPVLHLIATADIARGEKLSKACAACHSFEKGGPAKVGPNLWGVVNRDKGAVAGFSYSEAMATKEGNWNYQSLNHFLWKPKSYVPGTNMNYLGIKKPEDRAAMIAWLRTLSDSTPALPSNAQIEAEKQAFAPEPEEPAEDETAE